MRLAAFTDDPQIRNQLIQQAHHWMAVAIPTLRATRGQHWPFLYADEYAPWHATSRRWQRFRCAGGARRLRLLRHRGLSV